MPTESLCDSYFYPLVTEWHFDSNLPSAHLITLWKYLPIANKITMWQLFINAHKIILWQLFTQGPQNHSVRVIYQLPILSLCDSYLPIAHILTMWQLFTHCPYTHYVAVIHPLPI